MKKPILSKTIKLSACKRKIEIQKASDWFLQTYYKLYLPLTERDFVVCTYIILNDKTIEAKETIAIFRELDNAKLFFKTYIKEK